MIVHYPAPLGLSGSSRTPQETYLVREISPHTGAIDFPSRLITPLCSAFVPSDIYSIPRSEYVSSVSCNRVVKVFMGTGSPVRHPGSAGISAGLTWITGKKIPG